MDFQTALNRSSALCSRQEYCRLDLRRKHEKWDVSPGESEKIINYLVDEKFIDEERYAHFYVRDKFKFNRWGKYKITWQLRQKKLDDKLIGAALKEISDEEYLQVLESVLQEKLKQAKEKDPFVLKAGLVRYAVSKGYEYDIVLPAVDRLLTG